MFGLTFEKLLVIGVIAVFLVGPQRLPHYSSQLARLVRNLRDMARGAKARLKEEMGEDFDEDEWRKLDPRQYDPRRIIRDALLEDESPNVPVVESVVAVGVASSTVEVSAKKRLARDVAEPTPFDSEST